MLNLVREGEEDYIEAIRYRRRLKIFENFLFFIDAPLKIIEHSCPGCCPAGSIFRALVNITERDAKFTRSDFKNNFRVLYAGTDNDRSENKGKTSFCDCRHYAATELATTGIQNCLFFFFFLHKSNLY